MLWLGKCSGMQLFLAAVVTRLCLMTVMMVADAMVLDYDMDPVTSTSALACLNHWDALHFWHIAKAGYTHEHLYAFFPGLPFLVMRPAMVLFPASLLAQHVVVLVVNLVAFSCGALVLRDLTWAVLRPNSQLDQLQPLLLDWGQRDGRSDAAKEVQWVGAVIFLYLASPASVFTVASYTEPLFALLTFTGLLFCARGRWLRSVIPFSAASWIRSNGMLHAGYFGYCAFIHIVDLWWGHSSSTPTTNPNRPSSSFVSRVIRTVVLVVVNAMLAAVVCIPFVVMSVDGWTTFCTGQADPNGTVPQTRGSDAALCPSVTSPFDFYGYIQFKYWKVGWFTYYTPNNIPNFVIALPVFLWTYFALRSLLPSIVASPPPQPHQQQQQTMHRRVFVRLWLVCRRAPSIVLLMAMLCLALTKMNVQVVNRFVFACPALYWLQAAWLQTCGRKMQYIVLATNGVWIVIGAVFFSNHLPWT